jgi:hypothetical protein
MPLPINPAAAAAAAAAATGSAVGSSAAAAAASSVAPRSHLDMNQLLHTSGSAGSASSELPPAAAAAAGSGGGSARAKDESFVARHQHQYGQLPAQHEHARTGTNYAAAAGISDTRLPQGNRTTRLLSHISE